MTAQWLVAQAIQLIFGKTTQTSAAAAMSANAQATALQAGLAAFASTAAIPIVGPALAPGAMAAALGIAEPMAAAVGTIALSGAAGFRDGGYTGNGGVNDVAGVVHGKEFVFDAASTARIGVDNLEAMRSGKLDRTLDRVQAGMSSTRNDNRSVTNNFYQYGNSSREQRDANAKAARQISRIVNGAQRYD
ncbi:hypothetical protein D9M70_541390 [compost metagenome]